MTACNADRARSRKATQSAWVIRAFSDRLKAAGKPGKVRIVACMRKLLTLLNAMARENLKWDQLDVVTKLANNP